MHTITRTTPLDVSVLLSSDAVTAEVRDQRADSLALFGSLTEGQRYGNNVLVTWDERDPCTDAYLHAALMLGMALVARTKSVGDAGDITALRDIEHRVEQELNRLDKMEKSTESIRKSANNIDHEISTARKALDLLLRKAQSTLRALHVELYDETVERQAPIALTAESLKKGAQALAVNDDASAV